MCSQYIEGWASCIRSSYAGLIHRQNVGFRLLPKFGTKGVIYIGKAIPVVGGVISGGFDFVETKIIADRAYKMFILNDFSAPEKKGKGKAAAEEEVFIVDAEDFETVDVAAETVVEAAPIENAVPVEDTATEIEV